MNHRSHRLSLASVMAIGIGLLGCAMVRAQSPVRSQLFDDGWYFHRGDVTDMPQAQHESWPVVNLPHDWAIEDLPSMPVDATPTLSAVRGDWRFSFGDQAEWKNPDLDDSSWQVVHLPARWSVHSGKSPVGFGWYRRKLEVPAELRGKVVILALGKIDDCDETFVNGKLIGSTGQMPPAYQTAWETPRRYSIPAGLLKGDGSDCVAVRDYNGAGDAGMYEESFLPHRSGPFDSTAEGGTAQGYTLGGIGWYVKTFATPAESAGKHVEITFDGVYMNSQVWLNGTSLGTHPYGYTGFSFDITPHLKPLGEMNELIVKVDASGNTSRWYSGAGIFRHVWLTTTNNTHIAHDGICITTENRGDANPANIHVHTAIQNASGASLTTTLVDDAGKEIASISSSPVDGACDQTIEIPSAKLWSCESPTLYHAISTVTVDGKTVDQITTPFGIRSISIDAEHGFVLNGKPLKLRGGCVHHDNGVLGSAAFDRAEFRRVQLLKANGFNAIRTSHNPPSPAFLDACDQLGMLVLDESFDCWRHGKNNSDYGRFFEQWWKQDLDAMLLRDRNHPAIVLWSIGNEIPEQNNGDEAAQTGKMLVDEVHRLDPTRPVGQATNPDKDHINPLLAQLDWAGYNYESYRFPNDHKDFPKRVFASTESFPSDCFKSWIAVEDHPYVIGDFVWTALDYLGEAGIGHTDPKSNPPGTTMPEHRLYTVSHCGDLDLLGDARAPAYYRQTVWGVGPKVSAFALALGPDGQGEQVGGWGFLDLRNSWTWPGREGKPIQVSVYSHGPRVKLMLNGHDLGTKDTNRSTEYTAVYEFPYEKGELDAIALNDAGAETGRWIMKTAGPPAAIRLTPDRTRITAAGQDLAFVMADVVDAAGNIDPNSDALIDFKIDGPCTLAGVGNADPHNEESFQQPRHHVFQGRCMIVLRAGGKAGLIHLKASAAGLGDGQTAVEVK